MQRGNYQDIVTAPVDTFHDRELAAGDCAHMDTTTPDCTGSNTMDRSRRARQAILAELNEVAHAIQKVCPCST